MENKVKGKLGMDMHAYMICTIVNTVYLVLEVNIVLLEMADGRISLLFVSTQSLYLAPLKNEGGWETWLPIST